MKTFTLLGEKIMLCRMASVSSNPFRKNISDFLGGTVNKNLHTNAATTGLIPGLGRFHMLQSS